MFLKVWEIRCMYWNCTRNRHSWVHVVEHFEHLKFSLSSRKGDIILTLLFSVSVFSDHVMSGFSSIKQPAWPGRPWLLISYNIWNTKKGEPNNPQLIRILIIIFQYWSIDFSYFWSNVINWGNNGNILASMDYRKTCIFCIKKESSFMTKNSYT